MTIEGLTISITKDVSLAIMDEEVERNFIISPINKKSFLEIETYTKIVDGEPIKLCVERGWRWGSLTVQASFSQIAKIIIQNPDGFTPSKLNLSVDASESYDGCWSELIFPKKISEKNKTAISKLFDAGGCDALEEADWEYLEVEETINGPLVIKDEDGFVIVENSNDQRMPSRTPWYGAAIVPARKGLYEVSVPDESNTGRAKLVMFDGRLWHYDSSKPARLNKKVRWRGLSASHSLVL